MSACASVLTVMNSTPCTPSATMRSTAFEPPPPAPTTLISACGSGVMLKPLKSAIGCLLLRVIRIQNSEFRSNGCYRCRSPPIYQEHLLTPDSWLLTSHHGRNSVSQPLKRSYADPTPARSDPVLDMLCAAMPWRAPQRSRPTQVAYGGLSIESESPVSSDGAPTRTGMPSISRMSSSKRGNWADPPVSTTPAGSNPSYPLRRISL